MLFLIIAILAILIISAIVSNGTENSKVNSIREIQLDVPNPVINPEKFLDFIDKTNAEYLWQIERQLDYTNNLQNIILRKAINDKSLYGTLNKDYYLGILVKSKVDSYNVESLESSIDEEFKFITSFKIAGAFISYRKENLIFNVEEGSGVVLKREPNNKFDPNAIAVMQNKSLLGYVPKHETEFISEIMKFNHVAKIADIIYIDDFIDVIVNIYRSDKANSNPQYYLNKETILELRSRKIDSKLLRPKKDAEDVNMFFKRKVVITGEFDHFVDRNDLALILYNSGADIDTAITQRVHYVIAGKNPGWSKIEKAKEFGILIFDEIEIRKILNI